MSWEELRLLFSILLSPYVMVFASLHRDLSS
jgi:cytochrome c oxidase subunit IV